VGWVAAVDHDMSAEGLPPGVELVCGRPGDAEVKEHIVGATEVVVVGTSGEVGPDGLPGLDLDALDAVLDAAANAGIGQLIVVSSAMVYGAWPNHPVPLTEDAPIRPDPSLDYALARAEAERRVLEWHHDHADSSVTVLRPVVSVSAESEEWLALSPWTARLARAGGDERPAQYLHLDDLARAVDHARRVRLDATYNVAPDGWLSPDALAQLASPVGRLHLPEGWTDRARQLGQRLTGRGDPPGASYTRHPWVVANDRLRATGWEPHHRNDEVYIEADPGGPLATMSAKRRQQLSLAASGVGVGLVATGVALGVRRVRRRRSA
jgi:nucleoside-diphosphate-sugar epimerase